MLVEQLLDLVRRIRHLAQVSTCVYNGGIWTLKEKNKQRKKKMKHSKKESTKQRNKKARQKERKKGTKNNRK